MVIERLRTIRELRGLSQQELADRVEISLKQLWRYEKGENDPTGDVLVRLSKELEVSTDWLLGLVDEPTGRVTENDLSPLERRILSAYRRGDLRKVLAILGEPLEEEAK